MEPDLKVIFVIQKINDYFCRPNFQRRIIVDYLEQFVIPFHGLKNGTHHYNYIIDNEFFENFEFTEITEGDFRVDLNLEKQERMLEFEFAISGKAKLDCDRCGGDLLQAVDGKNKLIIKFGPEKQEISDEILIIPESEHRIDISSFIYEFIMLHLPYKRVHAPDEDGNSTCNPEVIERLGVKSEHASTDPRWEALKKVKFK